MTPVGCARTDARVPAGDVAGVACARVAAIVVDTRAASRDACVRARRALVNVCAKQMKTCSMLQNACCVVVQATGADKNKRTGDEVSRREATLSVS